MLDPADIVYRLSSLCSGDLHIRLFECPSLGANPFPGRPHAGSTDSHAARDDRDGRRDSQSIARPRNPDRQIHTAFRSVGKTVL
jgi:hypothetical protein